MTRFVAAVYDRFMRATERACLSQWRHDLLSDVSGRVLEVGAGTGSNLAHYPATVASLTLCEPDPFMRRRLEEAVESQRNLPANSLTVCDASLDRLPFEDRSFDAVVCTLVLCSVADPARAASELRRVLAPNAKLYFIEHVAASDNSSRLRWQRRVEPVWKQVSGNCHVTRDTEATLRASGLVIESIARESVRKALPWVRPSIRGVARNPG